MIEAAAIGTGAMVTTATVAAPLCDVLVDKRGLVFAVAALAAPSLERVASHAARSDSTSVCPGLVRPSFSRQLEPQGATRTMRHARAAQDACGIRDGEPVARVQARVRMQVLHQAGQILRPDTDVVRYWLLG